MKTTHLTPAFQNNAETQPLPLRWPALGSVLSWLALFLCLAVLLAGGAFVGSTTISLQKAALARHATCHSTQVTLHGTAAPTIRCLDGQPKTARMRLGAGKGPLAQPLTDQPDNSCPDDSTWLYKGTNLNGALLCINGSGTLNLTDVYNWNDQVNSYWTGCYDDYFFVDVNRGGGFGYAPGSHDGDYSPWGNFPLGQVGSNQLSSVEQFNRYGGDNCNY